MRLKDEQIDRLAGKVLADLTESGLMVLKADRSKIAACITAVIKADLKAEDDLERDAEELLEKTLRAAGGSAGDIDRHKMLKMIKTKLAKERKMVL
ncbi:MAG: DUF507 family protein [Geobacteraceae bacterium]|nr:DUF507 family protein [Geobacteraceae bacterium]